MGPTMAIWPGKATSIYAHLLLQQVHTLNLLRHILSLHRDSKEVQNRLLGSGVADVAVCKHLACLVAMPQQPVPQRHPSVRV